MEQDERELLMSEMGGSRPGPAWCGPQSQVRAARVGSMSESMGNRPRQRVLRRALGKARPTEGVGRWPRLGRIGCEHQRRRPRYIGRRGFILF